MSKKRTGAKKFWNGVLAVFLTILGVATVAFAGLGIWKTVDLVKEQQNKTTTEEEEQKEVAGHMLSIEEQIANDMVA